MAMHVQDGNSSEVMGEINVTPMVDVMLVLLIIFMLVTPALVAGFNAQMPQGVHLKSRPDDESRVTLGIDRDGNYFLNKERIRREDAPMLLKREFDARPQDRVLFLKADRGLKYQEILDAMELARAAGARVVAAVTDQQPGTEPDDEETRR
ncbi:MAG TPA: biopolymer transporter ExbD [Longimicrobiales bacterium]